MLGLGLSLTSVAVLGRREVSAAALMLANESQGLAIDFTDSFFLNSTGHYGSARVKDTSTPANNYDSHPFGLLTYAGASKKWVRGPSGLLIESDPALTLPYEWDADGKLLGITWEPERTNVYLHSEDFSQNNHIRERVTATPNQAIAPDGTLTANLLAETSATGLHLAYHGAQSVAGTVYTGSYFVKKGPGANAPRYVQLTLRSAGHGASQYANFDIEEGTVVREVGNVKARIKPYGNGWFRISLTGAATSNSASAAGIVLTFINNNPEATRQPSYGGDPTRDIYVWGAQYEVGNYPSSYIPTAESAVTRAGDNLDILLSAFPFSATEGTIYADLITADGSGTQVAWQIDDGTGDERITFSRDASNHAVATIVDGSVSQVSINSGTVGGGTRVQHTFAWKADDCAASMDGAAASTDASATLPSVTTLRLGGDHSGNQWGGILRRLVYVPRRVSDTDLPDWRYLHDPQPATPVSVTNVLTGALTDDGVTIVADLTDDTQATVVVALEADTEFASPVYTSAPISPSLSDKSGGGSYYTIRHAVTGLAADTSYRYAVASTDGEIDQNSVGTFRTAPTEGQAAPFRFAFGSCSKFTSNVESPAYRGMLADKPLFFLHLGDLVYDDYVGTDIKVKRGNVRTHLMVTDVQEFYKTCPMVYTWSDHDSAGNDQHRSSSINGTTFDDVIRRSRQVYTEVFPHYDLLQEETLLQSWRIAKTCFILMDTQSRRDAGANKTCLGEEQQGLIVSLAEQAVADGCTLIFLVSAATWVNSPWFGWRPTWSDDQTALLDALKAIPGLPRVVVLVGDAHSIGADDGTNTDYSTGGGMDIVQFMSSPLHQISLPNTDPLVWLGVTTNNNNNDRVYAIVDVSEDNTELVVTFKGCSGAGEVTTIATYNTADLT